jgi:hypothetical protein
MLPDREVQKVDSESTAAPQLLRRRADGPSRYPWIRAPNPNSCMRVTASPREETPNFR